VAEITAATVKALRDQTGAGMMDCKRVLQDADGDVKRAVELLRERGLAKAGKREGRATSEGVIAIALDAGVGGMVELGCETDFVARTDYFKELADALASAVVADGSIDSAKALFEGQVEGEKVADKMTAAIAKLGENVVLKRALRLEVEGPGIAGGYVHAGAKLGVLVGLGTSASGSPVEGLAKDLAMHVAAADPSPLAVARDGISAELLASERDIYRKQAEQEGKPEKVIDRIVEGKLGKFTAEVCLLEQAFVKDPDRSIADLLRDVGKEVDAEIAVSGFRRFKLGEASEE
jgi:elongation factor Ts